MVKPFGREGGKTRVLFRVLETKKNFEELLLKISKKDEDYVTKKENLKKLNYQNTWNNVNQNLLEILNEN